MSRVIDLRLSRLEQRRVEEDSADSLLASLSDAELASAMRDALEEIFRQIDDWAPEEARDFEDRMREQAKTYRLDATGDIHDLWPRVRAAMDKEAAGATLSPERAARLFAAVGREMTR